MQMVVRNVSEMRLLEQLVLRFQHANTFARKPKTSLVYKMKKKLY